MNRFPGMSPKRLGKLVAHFPRLRIAVVGDFFLDKYLEVEPALAEVSLETAKTAHQVVHVRHSPGAAGTVVSNLAALGTGHLAAIGMIGDDGEGYDLGKGLRALGCATDHLHVADERSTPTYLKPRDRGNASLAGEHSRYDTKNREPVPREIEAAILASLDAVLPQVDALVVLDQVDEEGCGVVTQAVVDFLAAAAARFPGVVFWADSRRRIRRFRNVIIKPNQFEAVGRDAPRPDDRVELVDLQAALARLREATGAPICVTRGPAGMVVTDPEITEVPGVRLSGPIDPTGAGDSATAGAVLALAAGATLPEAALVGNLVASITVEQLATTGTAQPQQLPGRLEIWLAQQRGCCSSRPDSE